MNKWLILTLVILIAALGGLFFLRASQQAPSSNLPTESENPNPNINTGTFFPVTDAPNQDEAEMVGFTFMNDVLLIAPPLINVEAENRIRNVLSRNAQTLIDDSTFSRDIAIFVGIQDIPENGISVEDLQFPTDTQAVLTVGLNYTGSRTIKDVILIFESDRWKVDAVMPNTTFKNEPTKPVGSSTNGEMDNIDTVINYIANDFNTVINSINVINVKSMEWPDGCLGLASADEMCTMAIVPGYRVTVEIDGKQYSYRTSENSDIIKQE